MRYVEIAIPAGKRDTILSTLDSEGIDYLVTEETERHGYTAIVSFPLPTQAVEPVLEKLENAGLPEDATTVILDAEIVISRKFEQLEKKYEEDARTEERISRTELAARVQSFVPALGPYIAMIIASVVIATAGVLIDSAAVVVGSMVIAPLIGPALATSLGTVIQDRSLFLKGAKYQVYGAILAIVTAAIFAGFVRHLHLVPPGIEITSISQVRERIQPDFLALAVAIGAGATGALSLSTGVSTALVGVMIAVALVPPIAVIGIGIAWGIPNVVIAATVLVILNYISINLSALLMLWYQGYRPDEWYDLESARESLIKQASTFVIIIIALSIFLGTVTVSAYQTATTENEVRDEVTTVLEEEQYQSIKLIDLTIESESVLSADIIPYVREPRTVIVTVGAPTEQRNSDLATAIKTRISTDHEIAVTVRYIQTVSA